MPSEAEWEYAAKGGSYQHPFQYAGSDRLEEVGWFEKNSHGETKPVGLKLPNTLGLYDMSGNVWEWCEDHCMIHMKTRPVDGSAWTTGNTANRVIRGGSWNGDSRDCRVAYRSGYHQTYRLNDVGFRLSRTLDL